ncbi:MAG: FecR domain-containing protein, partial [Acidobacteriia bacterium]|nr:FecR domain-containing protein [Terriglobia bacterium]
MTKQRMLLWIVITVLLAGMVLPAHAAPGPKEPAPKVGQKAGAITALLPIATISRGTGKAVVTNEAKKGDELWWNDLVKTQKGGRARITLTDQSILSLGAQSDLRIVKHDDRSQQTALQLVGGRMRAEVAKITRQGGSFELRTPTAVAGVIGTDFGSDASSVGITVFLCIAGIVQVANNDPNVPGSVQCAPGLTTSVSAGKPPTIPSNATPQQIQQLIQDTEPAIISAISPSSVSAGTTVDAAIGGSKLVAVNAVSVDGTGITATLSGAPTDTSVTVHMVIAANATPGPRTVTLRKPSGAASAAVFTVMQPPTAVQTGDLKKPYHDSFDQERQSTKAGMTALIASVQQAVDQTLQQLQTANQGNVVDLGPATASLNQQIAAIQNLINQAGGQVDQAVSSALATFDTQYMVAYNALLQRNPAGAPDDTFNQALQAAYNQVNASLGQAFADINNSLGSNAQSATTTVNQVQQTWMTTITAA